MNKKIVSAAIALAVVALVGWAVLGGDDTTETASQTDQTSQDESLSDLMQGAPDEASQLAVEQSLFANAEYQFQAGLVDVTEGAARSVDTNGEASGTALATFEDGKYLLNVEMSGLPEPTNGEFYEGWIVRKEPFKFISTGELEQTDDVWLNYFMSDEDLTDFTQYVLTIEPDDGDPAPDAHILEGMFIDRN
ncbi:TPA: anti-sigma factor [Candidatus Saccharibacteria bacterium]|nr:anti-sigma factor [Candidatus Saccharibacteria bacterium]HIO87891.1 anti-sigma factor [Candidatus Saccharibacteria bacterium]